jgi:hypothetical protein
VQPFLNSKSRCASLDPLRYRRNPEIRSKPGDRLDDRQALSVPAKLGHEGSVNLDLVERKDSQIAHAGVAGALIITVMRDRRIVRKTRSPIVEALTLKYV